MIHKNPYQFGEKLLTLRKSKGWSQEDLADKLDTSRQLISKWEVNLSMPDINALVKMSDLFQVSLDELVRNDNQEKNSPIINVYIVNESQYNKKKNILEGFSFFIDTIFKINSIWGK